MLVSNGTKASFLGKERGLFFVQISEIKLQDKITRWQLQKRQGIRRLYLHGAVMGAYVKKRYYWEKIRQIKRLFGSKVSL